MADLSKIVKENIDGNFFVDSTCINCDTCRQLAPNSFADAGDNSYVFNQPDNTNGIISAMHALLSCPTGSIGTKEKNNAKEIMNDFPLKIDNNVYYCGFNSRESFGGNSYFVQHKDGNWLIDSPKYLPYLVNKFHSLGGIKYIFLTHRDDVADANTYAKEFKAQRIIHKDDLKAMPDSEIVIEGKIAAAEMFGSDFTIIPTPGHTKGHMVFLYDNKYLFTGDHLFYDRDAKHLGAFKDHCWYSWDEQIKSMENLLNYSFAWVLAGHGDRVHLDAGLMKKQLIQLIENMKLANTTH
jgi:glyoxylase-like metal-dependent hydrolase (beta-lactamase superfamily II)/ferredoxin